MLYKECWARSHPHAEPGDGQYQCAHAMKMALVHLGAELSTAPMMLLTVHDDLVVKASGAIADEVKEMATRVMREKMEGLFPGVPIEVDASICNDWSEKE